MHKNPLLPNEKAKEKVVLKKSKEEPKLKIYYAVVLTFSFRGSNGGDIGEFDEYPSDEQIKILLKKYRDSTGSFTNYATVEKRYKLE